MNVFLSRIVPRTFACLVLILTACAPQPRPSGPPPVSTTTVPRADDGPSTARHLLSRYNERVADCGGPGSPAFLCSGLILREAVGTGTSPTWDPYPSDQARGAISGAWLRGDAPFSTIGPQAHGVVFFPNNHLPVGTDKIYVLCAYPYDGATGRRPGGCGAHPDNPVSSAPCQGQGIHTAGQWHALWQAQPNAPLCGFDVNSGTSQSASIFMQVPPLMAMLNADPPHDEIVLQSWMAGAPAKRPVEAFFYIAGHANGKAGAQRDQQDYFGQTGTIVPVIRMRLPVHGQGAAFDFLPEDQSTGGGAAVAAELTRRYNDISQTQCDVGATPAFVCTGLIIRGTGSFSTAFHSWNPSPKDQNRQSVSAAFLRKDMKFRNFGIFAYHHGIVFYPKAATPVGKFGMDIRCAYPMDGGTDLRTDHGCGAYPGTPGGQECVSQGVTTAAQWRAHYQQAVPNPQTHMCGFGVAKGVPNSAQYFRQLAPIMAMQLKSYGEGNELVMVSWAQNLHRTLPIEAFFYVNGNVAGRNDSRSDQKDFYDTSARDGAAITVPIIRVTLPASQAQDAAFDYLPADQAVP